MSTNPEDKLIDLTIEEFLNFLSKREITPPEYVYGLDGLAELLGASKSYAFKIKKSGILDEAIVQRGRKIIIDKQKALNILKKWKMT